MDYWITNADSLLHQVFMIVMGCLYGFSFLFGISYKAANIYCYFILFPLSFTLLLKGRKKYLFIPFSILFFLLPGYEKISSRFFDLCCFSEPERGGAGIKLYCHVSISMCSATSSSVCAFDLLQAGKNQISAPGTGSDFLWILYLMTIYPNMKTWLGALQEHLV